MSTTPKSLRELHCDARISPIFAPRPRRFPNLFKKRAESEPRKEPVEFFPIRYPLGWQSGKKRRIIEETTYFYEMHEKRTEMARISCELKIKETLNTYADFVEANQQCHVDLLLPPFPTEKFHKKVVDVKLECLFRYRLLIDSEKIFTVMHEIVKSLPGSSKTPFSYLSYIPHELAFHPDFYKRCDRKEMEAYLYEKE